MMIKKLSTLVLILLAPMLLGAPVLAFNPLPSSVCGNAGSGSAVCKTNSQTQSNPQNPVVHFINVAVTIMGLLVGIFSVIMIIIGGLTMVTSSGNSEKVSKARARVLYSAIALAIAALSWTIVTYVINHINT